MVEPERGWRKSVRGFECTACLDAGNEERWSPDEPSCDHTEFEKDWGIPFQLRTAKP